MHARSRYRTAAAIGDAEQRPPAADDAANGGSTECERPLRQTMRRNRDRRRPTQPIAASGRTRRTTADRAADCESTAHRRSTARHAAAIDGSPATVC